MTEKKKLLEYCGFKPYELYKDWWLTPDGEHFDDKDELTCDWLFKYFIPAWQGDNEEDIKVRFKIVVARFPYKVEIERGDIETDGIGETPNKAFAEAALKVIETK